MNLKQLFTTMFKWPPCMYKTDMRAYLRLQDCIKVRVWNRKLVKSLLITIHEEMNKIMYIIRAKCGSIFSSLQYNKLVLRV